MDYTIRYEETDTLERAYLQKKTKHDQLKQRLFERLREGIIRADSDRHWSGRDYPEENP